MKRVERADSQSPSTRGPLTARSYPGFGTVHGAIVATSTLCGATSEQALVLSQIVACGCSLGSQRAEMAPAFIVRHGEYGLALGLPPDAIDGALHLLATNGFPTIDAPLGDSGLDIPTRSAAVDLRILGDRAEEVGSQIEAAVVLSRAARPHLEAVDDRLRDARAAVARASDIVAAWLGSGESANDDRVRAALRARAELRREAAALQVEVLAWISAPIPCSEVKRRKIAALRRRIEANHARAEGAVVAAVAIDTPGTTPRPRRTLRRSRR